MSYKGTRAERYRSRMRSFGRENAIRAGKRASEMLDKYVLARRGELTARPVILWGRILATALSAILILFLIIRFFSK